jgi:hypothetical protein
MLARRERFAEVQHSAVGETSHAGALNRTPFVWYQLMSCCIAATLARRRWFVESRCRWMVCRDTPSAFAASFWLPCFSIARSTSISAAVSGQGAGSFLLFGRSVIGRPLASPARGTHAL